MRGNFLQHFINVLLGFVLVTFLPSQLFGPPQPDFVSNVVRKEIVNKLSKENSDVVGDVIKKVNSCAAQCAEDYKHRCIDPFTIDIKYTETFCEHLKTELSLISFSQMPTMETEAAVSIIAWIRDTLRDACQSSRFLFFAIALFVVKYLHELSRIEDLFHVRVILPAWMNFVHFVCSLVLAAAIFLLILYSDTFVPWWLLVGIFLVFFVNDATLAIAKIMKRLEASAAKGWGVQWRIIGTWLLLDFAFLFYFLFSYGVLNSPPTPHWLAWLLLFQVGVPYVVGFDFYFKDYIDEAAAA